MKRRTVLLMAVFCCLLMLLGATAEAAAIFLETWSVPGDTAGWQGYNVSLGQGAGTLSWQLAPATTYGLIQAGALTSGAAFVGDVAAAGAPYYAFSLRPNAGTVVSDVTIYLDSASSTWRYTAALPQSDRWNNYVLPLDTAPGHWVFQMGPESLMQTLTNVSDFMIEIGTLAGGGGQLDDVGLGQSPEPTTVCLLLGGLAALALRRRRSSPKT